MNELPLGRFGSPQEIAPTAVLLAGDPGGNLYVGQTLGPNSGDVIREHDRGRRPAKVYRRAGFTGSFALGGRPAVVVVDFCRGFTDPACALGSDSTAEVERTQKVLDTARRSAVPVVFRRISYDEGARATMAWLRKAPSLAALRVDSPWVELDPRLGRLPSESLIAKGGASAFLEPPCSPL